MSENKDKPTVKPLPCGGHAIFAVDPKTKQSTQIGYIPSRPAHCLFLYCARELW